MPELFYQGVLQMSASPLAQTATELLWSEVVVNRIAVIVALALLVIEIRDIILLGPSLLRGIVIWKANVELEHSVNLSRTRNTVALVCGVLFCIIADRYSLLDPSWRAAAPAGLQLALTAAVIVGFVAVRDIFYLISPLRSRTSEFACTVRHAFYNYFILYVLLALVSTVILEAFGASAAVGRVVLTVEATLAYLIDITRTAQILSSRYGVFPTILYLCALELLPLGILILTCTR